MGGPLSVTFSDIYMQVKIENEVVTPLTPKFYRWCVDDVLKQRYKLLDILF